MFTKIGSLYFIIIIIPELLSKSFCKSLLALHGLDRSTWTTGQMFGVDKIFLMFLKEVSFVHQGSKNTVKQ